MSGFKFDADKRLYVGAQGGALARPGIARKRSAGTRTQIDLKVNDIVWKDKDDHGKRWTAYRGMLWLGNLFPVVTLNVGVGYGGVPVYSTYFAHNWLYDTITEHRVLVGTFPAYVSPLPPNPHPSYPVSFMYWAEHVGDPTQWDAMNYYESYTYRDLYPTPISYQSGVTPYPSASGGGIAKIELLDSDGDTLATATVSVSGSASKTETLTWTPAGPYYVNGEPGWSPDPLSSVDPNTQAAGRDNVPVSCARDFSDDRSMELSDWTFDAGALKDGFAGVRFTQGWPLSVPSAPQPAVGGTLIVYDNIPLPVPSWRVPQ